MAANKRQFLVDHLRSSQAGLELALSGVDTAMWNRKDDAGVWSIGECAEHIVMVTGAVAQRVNTFSNRPEEAFDQSDSDRKDRLALRAAGREVKVQAPPTMTPAGRYTSAAAMLADFRNAQLQLIDLATQFPEWLRGRFTEHMVFKKLDGYQWLLVSSCHTMRHTAQILEIQDCYAAKTSI